MMVGAMDTCQTGDPAVADGDGRASGRRGNLRGDVRQPPQGQPGGNDGCSLPTEGVHDALRLLVITRIVVVRLRLPLSGRANP
jgi:hypothetical protein